MASEGTAGTVDKTALATSLKSLVRSFLLELTNQFPARSELVLLKVLLDKVDPKIIAGLFTEHLLPLETLVADRDKMFFHPTNDIFGKLNPLFKGRSTLMWDLWSSEMSDDDRDIVWEWIDAILKHTKAAGVPAPAADAPDEVAPTPTAAPTGGV